MTLGMGLCRESGLEIWPDFNLLPVFLLLVFFCYVVSGVHEAVYKKIKGGGVGSMTRIFWKSSI